uniref:DUF1425 domain-containing protein n=1 Tax=Polynucleobacter sp. TaxID=2029855 RepID=UPI004048C653
MKKILLTIFAVTILSACSSGPSIKESTVRMGKTDNIEITDMRSIVRNGVLTVQVSVTSKNESNLVAYRFRWVGKNGIKVFDDEAWKPLHLSKGHSKEIIGIAPTPDAVDFKFEMSAYK